MLSIAPALAALVLPLTALPPATIGVPCRLGRPIAMRAAACEAAPVHCSRRSLLLAAPLLAVPAAGLARTPGSEDVLESVEQIRDAAAALRKLRQEWARYAVINSEGRAGNIDAARRILGGAAALRPNPSYSPCAQAATPCTQAATACA